MGTTKWNFSGRTALVTGGSRGIGREIVKQLAVAGATVLFTFASDDQSALSLMEECNKDQVKVHAIQSDFTESSSLIQLIERIQNLERLDYIVNNAGLIRDSPMYSMTDDQWNCVMQVNLNAIFTINRGLFRKLALTKGCIVNMTSIAGIGGGVGQVNYSAAKAGVIGFTKALAREAASLGVRVCAVAPGYVETEILSAIPNDKRNKLSSGIPLKRLGNPAEVAHAVLFLLSEEASYITGQVLTVDGGII